MDYYLDNSTKSLPSLYIMMLIFGIISFFLTISLLVIVGIARVETSYMFILVTNIIIANLIHTLSYIFNWVLDDNSLLSGKIMCQAQAVFMIWSSMSQELWISVFALVAYLMLIKGPYLEKKKLLTFVIYYLLCLLLPLIISLIFYFSDYLGQNKHYCWVKTDKSIAVQIIIYGMRYFNFLFNFVLTFFILRYLCSLRALPVAAQKVKQFIMYPIIQVLGMILPSLNRFYPLNDKIKEKLAVPALISVGLRGVLFPICFGWSSDVFYLMGACFKKKNNKRPDVQPFSDGSLVDDLSSIQ